MGVIGFRETVGWVDSAVFILALLLRYMEEGVFHMKRVGPRPQAILERMLAGPYRTLGKELGVVHSFNI